MSNNDQWLSRSRQAVWHPCTQMKVHEQLPLLPIARAAGVWLYDFDGKRYFDGVSSWWVNLFGHAHPRLNAALKAQLDELEHVMLAGFTHRPVVELSERLAALSGLGHCMYGSDGASATEMALKMSFHYWRNGGQPGKRRFIGLSNGYHGETLGALAVTDIPLFREVYAPLLQPAFTVPVPDSREVGADGSMAAHVQHCVAALEAVLAEHAHEVAALIVEPLLQGAAGMVMYDASYLSHARRLCDQYGVHLIADEIAVGFGRSGTFFAHEQASIKPDFLCLSKGITGGYLPLACVLTSNTIYAAFYDDQVARGFLHSHSYTGNALACRAALTVLDIFADEAVLEQNRHKAELFSRYLLPIQQHADVRHFRHLGMVWAFEDRLQRGSRWWFSQALARGLLLRPMGATVYLMPPYILTEADMQHISTVLQDILHRA